MTIRWTQWSKSSLILISVKISKNTKEKNSGRVSSPRFSFLCLSFTHINWRGTLKRGWRTKEKPILQTLFFSFYFIFYALKNSTFMFYGPEKFKFSIIKWKFIQMWCKFTQQIANSSKWSANSQKIRQILTKRMQIPRKNASS